MVQTERKKAYDRERMQKKRAAVKLTLEQIKKVRDGYADQMKFCDVEAIGYFREFIRRIDEALYGKTKH